MKFLVDMPLSPALARWLMKLNHDAVHASDLALSRATDAEIIARAKEDARTIVTADLDYPRLLALAQSSVPSLILFRGGDWSEAEVIARLSEVLATLAEAEISQSITLAQATTSARALTSC